MADPVLSNVTGSFPWSVLNGRHPALIGQVRDGLPYPPERRRALDELAEEITGVIRPLPDAAHDREVWIRWGRDYLGQSWYDVPFLWAESYFYRKLLEAVGYFAPGPWRGIDPFAPAKAGELRGEALTDELAALAALPSDEWDAALLAASLWGNRADLGFQLGQAAGRPPMALVVDDSAALWSAAEGTVCVVADNAGRELVPDLLLADRLIDGGRVDRVVLHVKAYPYFTSDATMADVLAAVERLKDAPDWVGEAGRRLWWWLGSGELAVRAHPFSVAPWSYHHMPADLAADFADASLTIMKGDLNYRRLVGDRAWPADTPFATATEYFPGPVVALRTLKSEVVVGIPPFVQARLDVTGVPWRTDGGYAVVQAAR